MSSCCFALPGLPVRRLIALAALVVSTGMVASCTGVDVLPPDGSGSGTGGTVIGAGGNTGSGTSPALLGTWTRAILLADGSGDVHESRTTWEFRQDGSAIRTVLAWNLTQGVYDTIVTVAQWRISGAQLTITYVAPATGTASFAYAVNGDILTIGPDQFARLR
jgi:hypothetical protein